MQKKSSSNGKRREPAPSNWVLHCQRSRTARRWAGSQQGERATFVGGGNSVKGNLIKLKRLASSEKPFVEGGTPCEFPKKNRPDNRKGRQWGRIRGKTNN